MAEISIVDESELADILDGFYGGNDDETLVTDEYPDTDNEQDEDKTDESQGQEEESDDKSEQQEEEKQAEVEKEVKKPVQQQKPKQEQQTAPAGNERSVFSRFAEVLKKKGEVFVDEDIDNIETDEDFNDLIKKEVEKRLNNSIKTVRDALEAGVRPDVVQEISGRLNYLDSITEQMLMDDTNQGVDLRKNLIYNAKLSTGTSEADAKDFTEFVFEKNRDIDAAKRALESLRELAKYDLEEEKQKAEMAKKKAEEDSIKGQKALMEEVRQKIINQKMFGDYELSDEIRQKALSFCFDMTEPTKDGKRLQSKLRRFLYDDFTVLAPMFSIFYALTDGGKSLNKIINRQVAKKTKDIYNDLDKSLRDYSDKFDGHMTQLDADEQKRKFDDSLEVDEVL